MAFIYSYFAVFIIFFVKINDTNSQNAKLEKRYEPNWESIDSRPLPNWFDKSKFGIFVVWGLYCVPQVSSEWFWYNWRVAKDKSIGEYMKKNFKPNLTYESFASEFTTEFYNPDNWADLFEAAGARYVVLTSKHHEGYTLWPSRYSFNWNSVDIGPNRDLLGDLAAAIRNRTSLRFGVYYSLYEWFNPMYLSDKKNDFNTSEYVDNKFLPEIKELINTYKPEVVWADGDWEANDTYWKSPELLAWLYNESPVKDTVVTNDRWGYQIPCHHGGYFTCTDNFNPGILQNRKWENCMTTDKQSWGFRGNANIQDFNSIEDLVAALTITVSTWGNLLLNVGPTKEGMIAPIFQERLLQIGKWLKVNGDAIYETVPWIYQNETVVVNETEVWYTSKVVDLDGSRVVFAIVLGWPENNTLTLNYPEATESTKIHMLGLGLPLKYVANRSTGGITIKMPYLTPKQNPTPWGWAISMTNLANDKNSTAE